MTSPALHSLRSPANQGATTTDGSLSHKSAPIIDLSSAVVRLDPPAPVSEMLRGHWRPGLELREQQLAQVELREHLALRHTPWFKQSISADNVFVTLGVRDGLHRLAHEFARVSRGFIALSPCFPGYREKADALGVPVTNITLRELSAREHRIPVDKIAHVFGVPDTISANRTARVLSPPPSRAPSGKPSPGAIIITAPNTPTNTFPNAGDLVNLNILCQRHCRWMIVDNTFDSFDTTSCWRPPPLSLSSTIVMGSISEAYSLSQYGLQIGYLIAERAIVEALRTQARRESRVFTGPHPRAVLAANLSLNVFEEYLHNRNVDLRGRHAFAEQIRHIRGVTFVSGDSGTTKWVECESTDFADGLAASLANSGIQITPGSRYSSRARLGDPTKRGDTDVSKADSETAVAHGDPGPLGSGRLARSLRLSLVGQRSHSDFIAVWSRVLQVSRAFSKLHFK